MATNPLSNIAKRDIAFSGRADVGNVPELYAMRRAMQGTGQADMGGTAGLASGAGGSTPLDSSGGFGGGGAVGGRADIGLPGASLYDQDREIEYTRLLRQMQEGGGEGPDRGEIASRGGLNVDPADPFGVGFGQGVSNVTQIASLLGVPTMGMANQFVNLMLQDAQSRNDAFFDSLIEGTAPLQPGSGVTIERSGSFGPDFGAESGSDFGADLATGDVDIDTSSGVSIGRRDDRDGGGGDAGSGGGGGQGQMGGEAGCFAAGTKILMADGSEKGIEQIQLGDKVMGFNEDEDPEPCEVIGRFAHRSKPVWRLNGNTLVTPAHRFFALIDNKGHGFWPLEEIPIGAKIMAGDGGSVTVETIENAGEQRDVFNITVQRLHTYISNGFRVHNRKEEGGEITPTTGYPSDVEDRMVDMRIGEHVLTEDAVRMAGGPAFFDGMNMMARLARKR